MLVFLVSQFRFDATSPECDTATWTERGSSWPGIHDDASPSCRASIANLGIQMTFRTISKNAAVSTSARSLRSTAAIAVLAAVCSVSSPAWCRSSTSLWVADTDNNRIVELVPSDLQSSGTPTPLMLGPINSVQGPAFDRSKNLWVEGLTIRYSNLPRLSSKIWARFRIPVQQRRSVLERAPLAVAYSTTTETFGSSTHRMRYTSSLRRN